LVVKAQRQQGSVLIMALLIVALVAGLSIKFSSDYELGIARAENRWHGLQATAYLQGIESLAINWLKEDDPTVDYIGEGWDTEIPYEIEGGWLTGSLSDASSRINLNSLNMPLVPEKPANSHERYSEAQRRFLRLLQAFPQAPLDLNEAVMVLEAIVDWMDADDTEAGFGGAETNYYQSTDVPYRAANGPFKSVDELRLVRYMTPQLMMLLRPYITILPGDVAMNVNTLPPMLIRTLNSSEQLAPLSETDAQQIMQNFPMTGFYSEIGEFKTVWDQSVGGGNLDTSGLAVNTSFFLLRAEVTLVEQRRGMLSLLQRDGEKIQVIQRQETF
jgi:general secretion pathway protein K